MFGCAQGVCGYYININPQVVEMRVSSIPPLIDFARME